MVYNLTWARRKKYFGQATAFVCSPKSTLNFEMIVHNYDITLRAGHHPCTTRVCECELAVNTAWRSLAWNSRLPEHKRERSSTKLDVTKQLTGVKFIFISPENSNGSWSPPIPPSKWKRQQNDRKPLGEAREDGYQGASNSCADKYPYLKRRDWMSGTHVASDKYLASSGDPD